MVDEYAYQQVCEQRDALAESAAMERTVLLARLAKAEAEISRLRGVMIDISKGLGYGVHIIVREERDRGPLYTCGIHNVSMNEHGNRCPECDALNP